jgi:predicted nucleic acid-binding protein
MILVDTSVLIDFFRGSKGEAVQKFRRALQQGIPFGINSLIFQEILQGAKTEEEYGILNKYLGTQRFYLPKDPIDSFAKAAKIYLTAANEG